VVHADLAPTLAALLHHPGEPAWRGRSLVGPGARGHAYAHAENASGREVALVSGSDKLVLNSAGHALARFDLAHDPEERTPLAARASEAGRALVRALMTARPDLVVRTFRVPRMGAALARAPGARRARGAARVARRALPVCGAPVEALRDAPALPANSPIEVGNFAAHRLGSVGCARCGSAVET